jgi:hypothetical protein
MEEIAAQLFMTQFYDILGERKDLSDIIIFTLVRTFTGALSLALHNSTSILKT